MFTFRFQAFLETKRHLEELRERELAGMMRRQQEEQKLLDGMHERLTFCYEDYASNEKATIWEIRRYQDYFAKLSDDISGQNEKIEQGRQEIDEKREELLSVQKERLALEKLRDKDYGKYQDEVMRWEQKSLDEVGTNAYVRNRGVDQAVGEVKL